MYRCHLQLFQIRSNVIINQYNIDHKRRNFYLETNSAEKVYEISLMLSFFIYFTTDLYIYRRGYMSPGKFYVKKIKVV